MGGGASQPTGSDAFPWYVNQGHEYLLGLSRSATGTAWYIAAHHPFSKGVDQEASANKNQPLQLVNPKNSMLGSGNTIATYTSVFEMFKDKVADTNLTSLWTTILADTLTGDPMSDDYAAELALLNSEVDSTSLPKINAGMRDINAVLSSSFIYNKTLIEAEKLKALEKYSTTIKMRALEVAMNRYKMELDWKQSATRLNADLWKFYWISYHEFISTQSEFYKNFETWRLIMLDHLRAHLAASRGGTLPAAGAQASTGQKALSGALAGASVGAVGGPTGAAVGAVIGGIAGAFT
jgi:hypothetical protein